MVLKLTAGNPESLSLKTDDVAYFKYFHYTDENFRVILSMDSGSAILGVNI